MPAMTDKRRPFMSDDERAMLGREERRRAITPAQGVPVQSRDSDDFTPIGHIVAQLEERIGELSHREKLIVQAFGQHTANMEMRGRQRSDSQESATLMRRLDVVEDWIIDIVGKDGRNGKIGTLKERIDKAESRRWWAITFLAGLLVTVIGSAIAFGSWMGSIEADVEMLKQRRINRSTPEYPAAREATP